LAALISRKLSAPAARQFAQLMLFASLPPAALNYLLAERYQQEPEARRVAGAHRQRLRHRVRALGMTLGCIRSD